MRLVQQRTGETAVLICGAHKNVFIKKRRDLRSCEQRSPYHFVLFFSLVGSLNKIPISIAGILLFNVPVSVENFCSIVFGKYLFRP